MLLPLLAAGSLAAPPLAGGSTNLFDPGRLASEGGLVAPESPDLAEPVVGGSPAPPGKWPDAVALFAAGGVLACTGVLVAPDVVLTAGHCQYGLVSAVVGTNDLRNGGVSVPIVDVIGHDAYTSSYDVALVLLERPIAQVPPRVLAADCVVQDYVHDGAEVQVVGFGAIDRQATSLTMVLHEARTTVVDADCSDLSAGCFEAVSPGGELSAGGDGVDSCVGDSGGPLYLETPQGAFLLGTTSRAVVPASSVCGDGGIYVRADAVAGWIEAQLGHALERPACEGWNHVPQPIADPIVTSPGDIAVTAVDPGDPDEDGHVFEVVEQPAHGRVVVTVDGAAYYAAPLAFSGDDRAVVRVTDDGDPPLWGEVEIPITVGAPDGRVHVRPRGCSTAPGTGGLLALVVAAVGRRRALDRATRLGSAPSAQVHLS